MTAIFPLVTGSGIAGCQLSPLRVFLSCRDPRFRLPQITWRTSVAYHPTEDKSDKSAENQPNLACENFLYYFKAAPRGRSRHRHGARAVALAAALATAGPVPVGWREEA
jgi:hypothetical protein